MQSNEINWLHGQQLPTTICGIIFNLGYKTHTQHTIRFMHRGRRQSDQI